MSIGFVLEKVRHGSALSTGELKMLGDEIDRLASRLEGCAQEVARRDEADKTARQLDRARAKRLRLSEEKVERQHRELEHLKRQRTTETNDHDQKMRTMTGILRDVHYGLLYQPELTREELANVIAAEVTPHPNPYQR